MKAKVISYNLATLQATEDILNEWLEDVGDVRIDKCVTLGNAGPDRDAGGLVIFYSSSSEPPAKIIPKEKICRQCKKREAIEGMKTCEECREYQRQYRRKQKEDKKKARYP